MTFQKYIQFLQDKFVREGGHPDTEDVSEAISFYGYLKPKFPLYSFQISIVESWFGVNHAVKNAKGIKGKGIGLSKKFVPLVERGNALEKEILGYWDQVKDLPILDLREAIEDDPRSKTRKLYDAICDLDKECSEFEKVVDQKVRDANVILEHYGEIRVSNNKSFTKENLQTAIDTLREQKVNVTQKGLASELGISSVNTLKDYLIKLEVTKDDLNSAARGKLRLK